MGELPAVGRKHTRKSPPAPAREEGRWTRAATGLRRGPTQEREIKERQPARGKASHLRGDAEELSGATMQGSKA